MDGLLSLIRDANRRPGARQEDAVVATVSDADIDTFIGVLRAEDGPAFDKVPDVDKDGGFRVALKALLEGRIPTVQRVRFGDPEEFGFPEKLQAGRSLVRTLGHWRERIAYALLANEFDSLLASGELEQPERDRLQELKQRNERLVGPDWDRYWHEVAAEWESKRAKLSNLLREAADLYESGQAGADVFPFPTLENTKRRAKFVGLAAAKYSGWGVAERLRAIRRSIDETPVEVLFPAAYPRPLGWFPGDVGRRGGAANPEGALRGMVVREIAGRVPGDWQQWGGYSAVARLATFIGLEKCTPQYVRSLLSQGRT